MAKIKPKNRQSPFLDTPAERRLGFGLTGDLMTYTRLGKSNTKVSRICLGTMHFGPKADERESFRIMDRALEAGINFFDTADIYGGPGGWGRSETIVGNWLAQGGGRREKIVLATKVYWYDRDAAFWSTNGTSTTPSAC